MKIREKEGEPTIFEGGGEANTIINLGNLTKKAKRTRSGPGKEGGFCPGDSTGKKLPKVVRG